jgi:hypothetical protein
MNRRTVIAGLGAGGLAGLSGCLGLVGLAEHESEPAGVGADAREETGYERTGIDDITVERDVPGGPLTGTISVTNYMTTHEKAVEIAPLEQRQRAAVFNVLTTPQVEILGTDRNPVAEMSTQELIDLVRTNYDGIDDVSHEEDGEVTILEQSTTQSRFSADAEFDGRSFEVAIHVTEAVEAGDDLLVTIGVYPRELRLQEESNVTALAEAVTTDVDEDASSTGSESDGGDTGPDGSENGGSDGSENTTGSDGGDNESDDGLL